MTILICLVLKATQRSKLLFLSNNQQKRYEHILSVTERIDKIAIQYGLVGKDSISIRDSAIREFQEETGFTLSKLESKGFYYWEGEDDFKYFVFLYKATEYTEELKSAMDEGNVFWMDKKELESCIVIVWTYGE